MAPSPTTAMIRTEPSDDLAWPATLSLPAGGGPGEHEQTTLEAPWQRKVTVRCGKFIGDAPRRRRRESWRKQEAAVTVAVAGRGVPMGLWEHVEEAGGGASSSLRVRTFLAAGLVITLR